MPGAERTTDDLLALREIQSAFRLELLAQLDVGQREVVAHALVVRVGDLDRHVSDPFCEEPWSGVHVLSDYLRDGGDTDHDNDHTKHSGRQPSPDPCPDISPGQ